MATGTGRQASRWRAKAYRGRAGTVPRVVPMEARTLMAAGPAGGLAESVATAPGPSSSTVFVIVGNQPLFNALTAFLRDLNAAYGDGGTGTTPDSQRAIRADLAAISELAGPSPAAARLLDRLAADVGAISDAGTITAPGGSPCWRTSKNSP